jgi:23S rRNA (uracil1939-C5)-methyltransferase
MLLTIEKLVYGGDGLARMTPRPEAGPVRSEERGKAVFIPFVLEGEQVKATVLEQKAGFARARAERVVAASPLRSEPGCPYYYRCGGCHYQHTGYEHQLAIKTAILQENLQRLAKVDWQEDIAVHPSPPWNYRNRTRMQVSTGAEFALAYYRHDTHDLLPVEQCPISSPLLNRAIAAVWKLGRASRLPAALREVEFFADADDASLLLMFHVAATPQSERHATTQRRFQLPTSSSGKSKTNRERAVPGPESSSANRDPSEQEYAGLWDAIRAEIPGAAGVTVFAAMPRGAAARDPVLLGSFGSSQLTYHAGGESYEVSAGSFFQTNRHLADKLVNLVTADRKGALALDLYAGVGLFANVLAKTFRQVIAVEAGSASHRDLRRNAAKAHENVRSIHDTAEQYLERAARHAAPELIVADPPRSGLGPKVAQLLGRIAPRRLTYVSCDPATLSRDLRVLIESGFRVEAVHLIDLFPQTFHIESIVQLVR